jgi:hypothetical protein
MAEESPPGWSAIADNRAGKPIVTIADIVRETGLRRRTVRGMINKYHVPALPRYNDHDALRYLRRDLITGIRRMPGSGAHNRMPTPTSAVEVVAKDYLAPALDTIGQDSGEYVYAFADPDVDDESADTRHVTGGSGGVADVDPDHPDSGGTGNDPPDHHHKAGGPPPS